jgi:hypothetical protein
MMKEGLEELLMVENSRRNTDLVASLVLQKPELFGELMRIYLKNEEPVSRRAAWVADVVTEKNPELLIPFIEEISFRMRNFTHDGMKRESLKMLSRSPLPKKNLGHFITVCFDWLTSGKESVAVKMFSMEILYRISQKVPEIKKELADSIEWRIQEESPGFLAHAKKLLKLLYIELQRM